jgi:hypothetical protein
MLISGIWHGASIKYLIWGALHGLGMVAQNVLEKITGRKADGFLSGVITFHFVSVAWIFFRADGWQEALNYLSGFTRHGGAIELNVLGGCALLLLFFWVSYYFEQVRDSSLGLLEKTPLILKPVLLAFLVLLINLLGPSGVPAFLYYSY